MNKSESIIELAKALSKFQGEVVQPIKDSVNPHFKSKFTSLDNLIDSITKTSSKFGLSFLQFPLNEDDKVGIKTLIMHESGEWIEGDSIFVRPQKTDPQALGAVLTYLRRYSLSAIFGMASEFDDDGEGAMNRGTQVPPPKQQPKSTPPPKQVKLVMPKDANEAWNMIVPDMFTKHKGKTLGAVWKEDMPYIGQILSMDKAPIEITEGITLIQVAMAAKAAKEKQGE